MLPGMVSKSDLPGFGKNIVKTMGCKQAFVGRPKKCLLSCFLHPFLLNGLAFGGVNDKLAVTAAYGVNSATQTFQNDLTKTGYVIGGGVEYALSPAFSVKAEYQYIDLGGDKLSGSSVLPGNPTVTATGETNFAHAYDTVRLGLNYHILPGYEPLK